MARVFPSKKADDINLEQEGQPKIATITSRKLYTFLSAKRLR